MNKIKGLLLKDMYELKSFKKNFFLSIFIYIVLILNPENTLFGASMISFIFGTYSIATFNLDEKNKTDRYVLTLPISKKDIVLSKYILVILCLLIGILFSFVIASILSLTNIIKEFNIIEYLESLLAMSYAFSIMFSIQIPCIYKFGAEKGRLQIYVIIMSLIVLLGVVFFLFPNLDLSFMDSLGILIPIILILLIIINYIISYRISIKIFNKKEL